MAFPSLAFDFAICLADSQNRLHSEKNLCGIHFNY